jgi:tetratricopeptide (TPR) repeat protein
VTSESVTRYASRNGKPHSPEDARRDLLKARATAQSLRHSLRSSGLPPEVMADLMMGILRLRVEGEDSVGYRIRIEGQNSSSSTVFVVKEDGKYLGLSDSEDGGSVGFEILDRLERNDARGAKQLLDWMREDQKLAGGEDAVAGYHFPRFWNKGDDPNDRGRYAAAALIAQGVASERAIPILQEGLQKAATQEAKLPFELALVGAYRNANQFEEMYPLAAQLMQRYPDSDTALNLMITAGAATKHWTEVEAAIRARMQKDPNDIEALRALAHMYTLGERYADAHATAAELLKNSRAGVNDYNEYAWQALFTGTINKEDLDAAERGVTMSNSNNAPMLHTQLCLQVEEGHLPTIRQSILHLMDVWNLEEPNDQTWYIFGRIAERLGAESAAINAYKRLEKPVHPIGLPSSTYALAARRLAMLEKTAPVAGRK